jgi:hypothetical protein
MHHDLFLLSLLEVDGPYLGYVLLAACLGSLLFSL